ncbi:hypothetical protein [Stutzerimonas nitrititolerans]|uniref:hypothetical protein n=1 Tax=Stutzerimonas nitrititolerans TaxID=2482751 RepID=UPI0028AC1AF9|nr:hypothetical protein [Stutzerimonas nitrititolerans]
MATSLFERLAYQVAQKHLPKLGVPAKVSKYVPAIRSVLQGDFAGAAGSVLDQLLGPMLGSSIEGSPLALAGGITLAEARRMFEESANTVYAKKNLWHINATNVSAGMAPNINLFATEVGYSPHTMTGEAVKIGSVWINKADGAERVEMRITTYDDAQGSVKQWFEDLRLRKCHLDGTFGLPSEYLVNFTITHASILEGVASAYTNTYTMEPGSIDFDLSRREDNLQELQMTFVQFDPFMNV